MWRIEARTRNDDGQDDTTAFSVEGGVDEVNARLAELRSLMPDTDFGAVQIVDPSEPAVPAMPIAHIISDRQMAQALALAHVITEDEALAWAARGDLPARLSTAIASLPSEQRFPARMLLSSATTYERDHPLVPALGAMLGYDAAALDALWVSAAAL